MTWEEATQTLWCDRCGKEAHETSISHCCAIVYECEGCGGMQYHDGDGWVGYDPEEEGDCL